MSGRLIVVSNRVPLGDPPSGGLVVALHACLKQAGGVWIGGEQETVETPSETLRERPEEHYRKLTFDLSEQDRQEFYLGFANTVFWPLCHRRADLIDFRREFFDSYMRVNRRLARMIAEVVTPEDRIWVHDYHFFPLAQCLRDEGVTARIGFFLHVPFPTLAGLDTLSDRDRFLQWIAAFDLVGLQSKADVAACLAAYRRAPQGELYPDGQVGFRGRSFRVASYPIGIDPEEFAAKASTVKGRQLIGPMREGSKLLIGADRLDYSKGLPQRLRAFESWLAGRKSDETRATMLQIAPPSRGELGSYQEIRQELEQIAGAVNGRHGTLDWTPIRYLHQNIPRETLASLFRVADAGLVTPLADGMNLVAKEYIAAQDPDDPGVLLLSRFAGAAEQLTSVLLVNPYDRAQMAESIGRALTMPLDERRERHAKAFENVVREDIHNWTQSYLDALEATDPAD